MTRKKRQSELADAISTLNLVLGSPHVKPQTILRARHAVARARVNETEQALADLRVGLARARAELAESEAKIAAAERAQAKSAAKKAVQRRRHVDELAAAG